MSKKIIALLNQEIKDMEESIETMQLAAANNPFAQNIDLGGNAKKALESLQPRIRVRIWQDARLKVLKQILESVTEL